MWAWDIAMYVCATEAFRPYAHLTRPLSRSFSSGLGRASICYCQQRPALLISHFGGKDILRGLYGSLAELIGPQIVHSDVPSSSARDFCLISILFLYALHPFSQRRICFKISWSGNRILLKKFCCCISLFSFCNHFI